MAPEGYAAEAVVKSVGTVFQGCDHTKINSKRANLRYSLQKCSAVSLCQASLGLTSRNYTQPKQAWQGHNFTVPVSCAVLCITCAAYGKPSKGN